MDFKAFFGNFLQTNKSKVPDRCVFESVDSAPKGLAQYDSTSDRWGVEFGGNLWKAVDHARSLGRTGKERTVAIIDSGIDTSIPRLKKLVQHTASFVPKAMSMDTSHGTLVALLISQVAPDAKLEIYEVATEEGPDEFAVKDALHAVKERNTPVVNLSLGRPIPLREGPPDTDPVDILAKHKLAPEEIPCTLCAAAKEVADIGNIVMAASGNYPGHMDCPARQEGVFAVAYQGAPKRIISKADDGGSLESTLPNDATQSQAGIWDFSISEIDGLLGTSFAAPILSGVAALGINKEELSCYTSSTHPYQLAHLLMSYLRTGKLSDDESRRLVKQCFELFTESLKRLPHVHCAYDKKVKPNIEMTPPEECASCGFFAEPHYVNFGLFLAEAGMLDEGRELLEVAVIIAPWSPDAAANLAAISRELGDINNARYWYKKAINLRPGCEVYEEALRRL